ncbi:MAG: diphosphomevalonate decarboxylase [Myxococcota bacterium]|nr:diphosphomevalonate decarboxylase [Myxococcota bacterium]
MKARAIAHPNIALIKYWGKRNISLNLPAVSSLSLTLDQFQTETLVEWGSERDRLFLNGSEIQSNEAKRAFQFLDRLDPDRPPCRIVSHNNFPTAAGLASSSSAFAALALAASKASGQSHTETELSILARQGSGSAARSLSGGWVVWNRGIQPNGQDSYGRCIAPPDHWDVRMLVAVVSAGRKSVGSTQGMIRSKETSPFYQNWVDTSEKDVQEAIQAVQKKDLHQLGALMEHSTIKMHAVMMTSRPTIRYWKPQSLAIIEAVEALRNRGIPCYQTMDAGPNVKILCSAEHAEEIASELSRITHPIHILQAGSDAKIIH